ncbi:Rrf2 family transcriptional regulator [Actinoplanes sp. NPDC051346]|uniref:RrF2 family transcriptional regulator n=1 Tax=Actinoplanes sp. NPDC051346 TaxID=3155048 RepID=UPI00341DD35C
MRSGRLPQSVEWAIHVCLVLAQLAEDELLPAPRLAQLFDLPAAYLAKVMQDLAAAGVVRSVPGRRGGYRLHTAPQDVSVGRIVRATGLADALFVCTEIRQRGPCAADPDQCRTPCAVAALMRRAEAAYLDVLDRVSLADLTMPGGRASADGWLTTNVHLFKENP